MAKLTREQKAHRRAVRSARKLAEAQQLERRDRIRYEYDGIARLFDSLEARNHALTGSCPAFLPGYFIKNRL
jgi:hypothetical protein